MSSYRTIQPDEKKRKMGLITRAIQSGMSTNAACDAFGINPQAYRRHLREEENEKPSNWVFSQSGGVLLPREGYRRTDRQDSLDNEKRESSDSHRENELRSQAISMRCGDRETSQNILDWKREI